MSERRTVAVIIVNYNTRDLLRACLASVEASKPLAAQSGLQIDTVIVDSASSDGSAEMVAAEFPHARLVAHEQNLGFSAGNNLGLKLLGFAVESMFDLPTQIRPDPPESQPDFVLLLNPDAELCGDALIRMAHFLIETPTAGGCGANLHYADGSFQHGAFRLPSIGQVLLDLFPLEGVRGAHRLHHSRFNGRYLAKLWQGDDPFEVEFVLGAALMARGSLIDEVGGLDEGFFMYCEEMDWCVRLTQTGHPFYAVPTANVLHHAGASSKQVRWPMVVQLWRSRLQFYQKHAKLYPSWYRNALRVVTRSGFRRKLRQAAIHAQSAQAELPKLEAEIDAYTEILEIYE